MDKFNFFVVFDNINCKPHDLFLGFENEVFPKAENILQEIRSASWWHIPEGTNNIAFDENADIERANSLEKAVGGVVEYADGRKVRFFVWYNIIQKLPECSRARTFCG